MPAREPPSLLGTNHFRVVIGRRELGFAEVGPLSSETGLEDERSHGFAPVVLRRALTQSTELYDWRRKVAAGKRDRRQVTIHQLDSAGGLIVNSWRLENAWPRRWSGPSFDAAGNDVAIEEVELCFDDLVWVAPPEPPPTRTRPEGGRRGRAA